MIDYLNGKTLILNPLTNNKRILNCRQILNQILMVAYHLCKM